MTSRTRRRPKRDQSEGSGPRAPYITRRIGSLNVLSEEGLETIETNADLILSQTGMDFVDEPEHTEVINEEIDAFCDWTGFAAVYIVAGAAAFVSTGIPLIVRS